MGTRSRASCAWLLRVDRLVRATNAWLDVNDRSQSHLARRLATTLSISVPTVKVKLSRVLSGQLIPTERSLGFVEALEAIAHGRDQVFRPLAKADAHEPGDAGWIGDLVVENHRARLQQLLDAYGGPEAFLHDHELYGQGCAESDLDPRVGPRCRTNLLDFYARNLQHIVEERLELDPRVLDVRLARVRDLAARALQRFGELGSDGFKPCMEAQIRHHLGSCLVLGSLSSGRGLDAGLAELETALAYDADELGWLETDRGRMSVLRDLVLNNGLTVLDIALAGDPDADQIQRVVATAERIARAWPFEHFAAVCADRRLAALRRHSSLFRPFPEKGTR